MKLIKFAALTASIALLAACGDQGANTNEPPAQPAQQQAAPAAPATPAADAATAAGAAATAAGDAATAAGAAAPTLLLRPMPPLRPPALRPIAAAAATDAATAAAGAPPTPLLPLPTLPAATETKPEEAGRSVSFVAQLINVARPAPGYVLAKRPHSPALEPAQQFARGFYPARSHPCRLVR
jgi:hypothetical protein